LSAWLLLLVTAGFLPLESRAPAGLLTDPAAPGVAAAAAAEAVLPMLARS
jgi:hypothetical protein